MNEVEYNNALHLLDAINDSEEERKDIEKLIREVVKYDDDRFPLDTRTRIYLPKKEKGKGKSNHRHVYENVLFHREENHYFPGTACKICSRVGKMSFFEFDKGKITFLREIPEKYKELRIVEYVE